MGVGYDRVTKKDSDEEEPITFDYLLKKVVENAAAMSSTGQRTTHDGTIFDDFEQDSQNNLNSKPAFEVRIDESEKVCVSEIQEESKIAVNIEALSEQ